MVLHLSFSLLHYTLSLWHILLSSAPFLSFIQAWSPEDGNSTKITNFGFCTNSCSDAFSTHWYRIKQMVSVVGRFFSLNFYSDFRVKFFSTKFTPFRGSAPKFYSPNCCARVTILRVILRKDLSNPLSCGALLSRYKIDEGPPLIALRCTRESRTTNPIECKLLDLDFVLGFWFKESR